VVKQRNIILEYEVQTGKEEVLSRQRKKKHELVMVESGEKGGHREGYGPSDVDTGNEKRG